MGLLKCPDCGKEFSDRIDACPNCACPKSAIKESTESPQENTASETPKIDSLPKEGKTSSKTKLYLAILTALLLVAVVCIAISFGGESQGDKNLDPPQTESEIIPFSKDPDAMAYASKSVVKIKVYNEQNEYIASGSGFFAFDSKTIVTNHHVIEDAYKIEIVDDDDKTLTISTIYNADKDKDIAILQISDSISGYSPLKIANSDNVKKGENIVAIGSPQIGRAHV